MAIFDQKSAAKKDTAPFNSDLPPFQAPPAATENPGTLAANAPRPQPEDLFKNVYDNY